MAAWTKEKALEEISALVSAIANLKHQKRGSVDHVRWNANALAFLEEVFGQESRYYLSLAHLPWGRRGNIIVGGPGDLFGSNHPAAAVEREHQKAYMEQLDVAEGILLAASDHLKRVDDLTKVYEGKDTAPESSLILKVINLADHKLRKTVRSQPSQEKEVQESFENLLIGADIDYTRDKETVVYSSKTYRPDFVIGKIDLAVEVKLCHHDRREKEIIAEINDDILAYQTRWSNLLFIVYDVALIRDIDVFTTSFEKNENVIVRVVKH
ncbi:MAG: hypothetical protein HY913_10465 [Desulfomonile tiedjei]|nr:hypothetical protein [Desulfomonile tiedjei]